MAHEKTPVADDFRIQAALAVSDPRERGLRLARVAAQARGINPHAAIAANYELGRLALRMEQSPAWAGEPFRPAHEYFEAVLTATDNPYRRPSQSHLEWLARNRIRQATTASRPEKKG